MNITFHAVMGIATGISLAMVLPAEEPSIWPKREDVPWLLAGLSLNVLLHGVLDILPHTYPFPWWSDIPLALFLCVLALAMVRRRYLLLLALSLLGALLPDLVDLGPPLLNHAFRWHLPTWEAFPWHWEAYSGSIYDGREIWLSALDHGLVLGLCAGLLWVARKRWVYIWRI